MREIYYLLKRNILLYIRDYVSVFFSVLSMLIVLALMVIFLGDMNSGNVVEALAQYGGMPDMDGNADAENPEALLQMWIQDSLGDMDNADITAMTAQLGESPDGAASEERLASLLQTWFLALGKDMDTEMDMEAVGGILAQFSGKARDTATDEKNASYLIQMWTLAGILVVNAITITMTVMGTMVQDEAKNRLASFYMTPVKRIKIALGYILSAWIVGTVMCVLTLILGELYMVICGHPLLAMADFIKLFGMIILNTFTYASIAYLLALFIHTESAWSSVLTIIGTLVGFVGAIYLPMSMLPEGVSRVLKCLPVLHGAAMMREICTREAIAQTFAGLPETAGEAFREQMGVSVFINGTEISLLHQILFLAVCGIIAITASAWISKGRKLRDR